MTRQIDLDIFIDGWKRKGDGYVWIQRGTTDLPMPKLKGSDRRMQNFQGNKQRKKQNLEGIG